VAFVLFASGLVIVTTLTLLQPFFYRAFPSDKDRHIVIVDALTEKADAEKIIVFGDSRTMFGVDTRIIREDLKISTEVLNLSSVGQNIYESGYFYGLTGKNTKAVVQCTSPAFFSRNLGDNHIEDDVALSLCLSGYSINDETKSIIGKYNEVFNRSRFVNYYKSRSIIRTYIHSNITRPLLDNEVFDESARQSVYFPHSYTSRKHPDYPVYGYDCSNFRMIENPDGQLSFLRRANDFFSAQGIEYIIVFMPVNPDECNECYQDFKKYADLIETSTDIRVINLADILLDTGYFYDATHANIDGARIISLAIAEQLKYCLDEIQ